MCALKYFYVFPKTVIDVISELEKKSNKEIVNSMKRYNKKYIESDSLMTLNADEKVEHIFCHCSMRIRHATFGMVNPPLEVLETTSVN